MTLLRVWWELLVGAAAPCVATRRREITSWLILWFVPGIPFAALDTPGWAEVAVATLATAVLNTAATRRHGDSYVTRWLRWLSEGRSTSRD